MVVSFKENIYSDIAVRRELANFVSDVSDNGSANSRRVLQGRRFGRGTNEYDAVKLKLHCWYFNGLYSGDALNCNFIRGTGLLYLDYDNVEDTAGFIDRVKGLDFVVALWESVSGQGFGMLIRIPVIESDKVDPERREAEIKGKFACAYRAVDSAVGVPHDPYAEGMSRACFQSFSRVMLHNPTARSISVDFAKITISKEANNTWSKRRSSTFNPQAPGFPDLSGLADPPGVFNGFKFSKTVDPFAEVRDCGDHLFFPKGKEYLQVRLPVGVPTGHRYKAAYVPMSLLIYINRHKPFHEFAWLMRKLMKRIFKEEWSDAEMTKHLSSWYNAVIGGEFNPNIHVKRKYVLVTDRALNGDERLVAGIRALHCHLNETKEWMVRNAIEKLKGDNVEVTLSSVAMATGLSKKTVKKYMGNEKLPCHWAGRSGRSRTESVMKRIKNGIDKILKTKMDGKKITQALIAEETGISRKTINKYWNLLKPYVEQSIEEKLLPLKVELNGIKYRLNRIENRADIQHAVADDSYENLFGEGSEYQRSKKELTELLDQA